MKKIAAFLVSLFALACTFAAAAKKQPANNAPVKTATAPTNAQIEALVRANIPAWLKAHPVSFGEKGKAAQMLKLTIEKTVPVSGYENTWSTSGKILLQSTRPEGSERGFDARTDLKDGKLRFVDATLGY